MTGEWPPERVIAWLRSPEGEAWSVSRAGDVERFGMPAGFYFDEEDDGVFGTVTPISELGDESHETRWPEPIDVYDLDGEFWNWLCTPQYREPASAAS